jgi:hypothetical protein
MDGGLFVLVWLVLTVVFLIIQRTERVKKRGVMFVMLLFAVPLAWFINLRDAWGGAVVALIAAVVMNWLFWVLVGRYNPVGSSDNIRVLGMDD